MGEFKGDEFRMRIILADVSSSEDPRARLPNENEITSKSYNVLLYFAKIIKMVSLYKY